MGSQNASERSIVPRVPRRKRGRERVAALLSAGAEIFAEQGYDAATMTSIAARAGASIGSLYQFFPTKYALAEALHAEQIEGLIDMLDSLRQRAGRQSAAERCDALFRRMADFMQTHPAFVTLADRRDIDKQRKAATRARLRQQIATLFSEADPPLAAGKSEIMAVVVLQMMRSVIALSNEADDALSDKALLEFRAMLRNHLTEV
jgi:AcrR family transcriptional regulator